MAENVHEQGIGTCTGVKLHPASLLTGRKRPPGLSVNLRQASAPRRICPYRLVASLQEVSMPGTVVVWRKAYDRRLPVTKTMRQSFDLGIFLSSLGQVTAKGSSKIHCGFSFRNQRHFHNCFHTCTKVCICRGLGR